MESYTLAEIASRVGGKLHGDPGRLVTGIRPLEDAGPDDLSFVARPDYRRAATESQAAGLIAADAGPFPGRNVIVVPSPYAAVAEVLGLFHPPAAPEPGLSPQASIGEGCTLGHDLTLGAFVVLGRRCVIGDRSVLRPGVIVGDDVRVGADCVLHPGVVIYPKTVLGSRVIVHANSVLGSDGFGYAESGGTRTKIPQVGNVVIGDDVEIGACVTIDRATFGSTVIGARVKIDNLVQVAHNVVVGEDSVLVAQAGIAGSARLGRQVTLAGQAGVAGHLRLGEGAVVGAAGVVLKDLGERAFVVGYPARDHREWKKQRAALDRLPELLHRVSRLEKPDAGAGASRSAAGRPARAARRRSTGR